MVHVLTLKQPWAWAVFHAGKDVENRSAGTPYRGRLYIHAGVRYDLDAIDALLQLGYRPPLDMPHGVIVGHVELVDVVRDSTSRWATPGAMHWILAKPHLLSDPIPHRGLPWLHRRKDVT